MELFQLGELQELIDLLCKIPRIEYPTVRYSLTATLPDDLRTAIEITNIPRVDIESIVEMVVSYAWFQLVDDRYPILVVIENAINKVRGSQLEGKLYIRLNTLRILLSLPPLDLPDHQTPQLSIDYFSQKLDDLIDLMSQSKDRIPSLEDELQDIRKFFNQKVLKPRCIAASTHLTKACAPIREFATILEETKDLVIKRRRVWLMNALRGFDDQAKVVENSIGQFCREYGTKSQQPAEKRGEIQQQFTILIQNYRSVLEMARKLRGELYSA